MMGISIECRITSEKPEDIEPEKFITEFIEWIESKGLYCDGGFL